MNIARIRNADSRARVIFIHGVGGHSGALWPLASIVASYGCEVAAVDLPLYGETRSPEPEAVRYGLWIDLLADFLAYEDDGRPVILFGGSMGGLLACEVATKSSAVDLVIATCLLNPQDLRAKTYMTRFGLLGAASGILSTLVRGPLSRVMVPIRAITRMDRMSNNPELSNLCATDPRGGGAKVPLGFLASYLQYRHQCMTKMKTPVIMAHPNADTWTPLSLSMETLQKFHTYSRVVLLRECGHFPIEEPGLTDLIETMLEASGHENIDSL